MTLQDTDKFLVGRSGTNHSVESQALMAQVEDTDLLLVSRSGSNFKVTGLELKDSFGSGSINPGANDISTDIAFQSGTGTEADPYVLAPVIVAPYGGSVSSTETLTIIGQTPLTPVVWTDNSVGAGTRFTQIDGQETDASGVWTGNLEYADIPASTTDTTYVGLLQIGLVFFSWTIDQREVDTVPPAITSVSLIENDAVDANRFTSQVFTFSTNIDDGTPTAVKTIDAHVDGTLTSEVQFVEPLESSSGSNLTFAAGTEMTSVAPGDFFTQPGPSGTATWSDNVSIAPNSSAAVRARPSMFDGNLTTQCYTENDTFAQINWDIGVNISGKTIKLLTGNVNTSHSLYFTDTNTGSELSTGVTSDASGFIEYDTAALQFPNLDKIGIQMNENNKDVLIKAVYLDDVIVTDGQSIITTITGVTASVSGTTITLSSTSGGWINGVDVTGPTKSITAANTRLYLKFDSSGNVETLINEPQDPPYTTSATNPGLTLTFPAVFPDGQAPDTDLPEGTTLTVLVVAENAAATAGPAGATVQPEIPAPAAPLAGLTTLYEGNASTNNIVNGVDLANNGGLVWLKNRENGSTNHWLVDTVRGLNSALLTNSNTSPINATVVSSFNTDGFTIPSNSSVNTQPLDYVAWTLGKAEGYFDIVEFTTPQQVATVNHSLGSVPGLIIVKYLSGNGDWFTYHPSIGNNSYLTLNSSNAIDATFDVWNGFSPTATQFQYNALVNGGGTYIAYLFAEDTPGVIKCGSYSGAGTTNQIDVGFKPQWVLIKSMGSADWLIFDNKRGATPNTDPLYPNRDYKEGGTSFSAGGSNHIRFNDNGMEINGSGGVLNDSSSNYIYVAIAEPSAAVSQTQSQFDATSESFETFGLNTAIYQGNQAQQALDNYYNS